MLGKLKRKCCCNRTCALCAGTPPDCWDVTIAGLSELPDILAFYDLTCDTQFLCSGGLGGGPPDESTANSKYVSTLSLDGTFRVSRPLSPGELFLPVLQGACVWGYLIENAYHRELIPGRSDPDPIGSEYAHIVISLALQPVAGTNSTVLSVGVGVFLANQYCCESALPGHYNHLFNSVLLAASFSIDGDSRPTPGCYSERDLTTAEIEPVECTTNASTAATVHVAAVPTCDDRYDTSSAADCGGSGGSGTSGSGNSGSNPYSSGSNPSSGSSPSSGGSPSSGTSGGGGSDGGGGSLPSGSTGTSGSTGGSGGSGSMSGSTGSSASGGSTDPICDTIPAPVFHAPFDETSGTVGHDVIGGKDVTFDSAPTWSAGEIAGAAFLDGSNEGNADDSTMPMGNAARTISLWVNPASHSASEQVLFQYGTAGHTQAAIVTIVSTDKVAFSNYGDAIFSPSTIPVDGSAWTHVVATHDGSVQTLYINGAAVATGTMTFATLSTGGIAVGYQPTTGNHLDGGADDYQVFDYAMSADQVAALYRKCATGGSGGSGSSSGSSGSTPDTLCETYLAANPDACDDIQATLDSGNCDNCFLHCCIGLSIVGEAGNFVYGGVTYFYAIVDGDHPPTGDECVAYIVEPE